MEFLYSLNRLNVATSRAQALCVLVASPHLLAAEYRTPRRMQLINALCRYLELAQPVWSGFERLERQTLSKPAGHLYLAICSAEAL